MLKSVPKTAVFVVNWDITVGFYVFCLRMHASILAVGDLKSWGKMQKNSQGNKPMYSHMCGKETTDPIWIKFRLMVGIRDVIT